MKQISFADAEYAGKRKKAQREVSLGRMGPVVPWKTPPKVLESFYAVTGNGRRPFPLSTMLGAHLMQNCFALSNPAMEAALYKIGSLRSGLVHTVTATAANESDVEQVTDQPHGKEDHAYVDSGYRGAADRVDREDLQWHIAARPSDTAKMPEGRAKARVRKQEHRKVSIRAKVQHPYRAIKRQFCLMKVCFRDSTTTRPISCCRSRCRLCMARKKLATIMGVFRP